MAFDGFAVPARELHHAALCLSMLGEPERALEHFDRALAANPGYVEAHINRALTLNELGRFEEAREAFELAGQHEQHSGGEFPAAATARLANAHAAVGDLYVHTGAHLLAAEQYRRALELRPGFHDIRNKLAVCLMEVGDLQGATAELQQVLDANPRFLDARMNLGLAYYRSGLLGDALREWELSAQQAPEHPQVRAYLALVERDSGHAPL